MQYTTSALNQIANVKTSYDNSNYYISINGGTPHSTPLQTFTGDYDMCLFGINNVGSVETRGAKFKIYHCSFSQNGQLIKDLVPCYRISDSVLGMYDLVNNVFYTNAGTGTFGIGKEVPKKTSVLAPQYTQTWISSLL